MFAQYQPNVKAAIAYLKLLKVKVNSSTVNETLQNHPDWPSLLCVIDSLNKWNIPNAAGKVELDRIDELPTPFIAHTNDRENPLAIVKEVKDTTVSLYRKNHRRPEIQNKTDFLKSLTKVKTEILSLTIKANGASINAKREINDRSLKD